MSIQDPCCSSCAASGRPDETALAIACTLDSGDFKERVASIRNLSSRHLLSGRREPLVLRLTYTAADALRPFRPRTGEDQGMRLNNTVKGAAATGGLAIAACAACCAPLIAAPVLGLLAAGGIGLALAGQIGIAILLAIGVVGYVWYRRRQRKQAAASSCECGATSGCKTGDMRAGSL